MGEMTDVTGDDVGHYEGDRDDETQQGDNDAQGDHQDGGMGLRKVLCFGTSDGNRRDRNISHFQLAQGVPLPAFRYPLAIMAPDSRDGLTVPFSFLNEEAFRTQTFIWLASRRTGLL